MSVIPLPSRHNLENSNRIAFAKLYWIKLTLGEILKVILNLIGKMISWATAQVSQFLESVCYAEWALNHFVRSLLRWQSWSLNLHFHFTLHFIKFQKPPYTCIWYKCPTSTHFFSFLLYKNTHTFIIFSPPLSKHARHPLFLVTAAISGHHRRRNIFWRYFFSSKSLDRCFYFISGVFELLAPSLASPRAAATCCSSPPRHHHFSFHLSDGKQYPTRLHLHFLLSFSKP